MPSKHRANATKRVLLNKKAERACIKNKPPIPSIVKARRKILACGCSHGSFINHAVKDELLAFKKDFAPDITLHLGDLLDTTAFMKSATASERGQSVIADCTAGIEFVSELEPSMLFIGNHDNRLYRELTSNNGKDVAAAKYVLDRIRAACPNIVEYSGTLSTRGWRRIGNVVFGHGVMYGEQAARDHAEAWGLSVVFAHTHKLIRQPGRTFGRTEGLSAGCLCDKPSMHYAAGRRATLAWDNGWLYGEIGEDDQWLQLYQAKSAQRETVQTISLKAY